MPAKALFGFQFVKEVFISENYISITKFDIIEWNDVYAEIRNFISSYLQENKTIIKELPKSIEKINKSSTKEFDTGELEGIPAGIPSNSPVSNSLVEDLFIFSIDFGSSLIMVLFSCK